MAKKTKPREQAVADPSRRRLAKRWVRSGMSMASVLEAIARIEPMEAKHGYRYDEHVPWDSWYRPLPCCERECCRG